MKEGGGRGDALAQVFGYIGREEERFESLVGGNKKSGEKSIL